MSEEHRNIHGLMIKGNRLNVIVPQGDRRSVCQSVLVDFDDDSFLLGPLQKRTVEVTLKQNDTVTIVYPSADALYEFDAQVGRVHRLDDGTLQYSFLIPRKGKRVQRRDFYRLPNGMEARYRLVVDTMVGKSLSLIPQEKWMPCFIDDISGGGMSIYMDTYMPLNSFIQVEFAISLRNEPDVYCELIKIVRSKLVRNQEGSGGYAYCYGGFFFSIGDEARNDIIRYILKRQIQIFGTKKKADTL